MRLVVVYNHPYLNHQDNTKCPDKNYNESIMEGKLTNKGFGLSFMGWLVLLH